MGDGGRASPLSGHSLVCLSTSATRISTDMHTHTHKLTQPIGYGGRPPTQFRSLSAIMDIAHYSAGSAIFSYPQLQSTVIDGCKVTRLAPCQSLVFSRSSSPRPYFSAPFPVVFFPNRALPNLGRALNTLLPGFPRY